FSQHLSHVDNQAARRKVTASGVRFPSCQGLRFLCIIQQNLHSAYLHRQDIPPSTLVHPIAIPEPSRLPFSAVVVWHGLLCHLTLSSANILRWHIVCRLIFLASCNHSYSLSCHPSAHWANLN